MVPYATFGTFCPLLPHKQFSRILQMQWTSKEYTVTTPFNAHLTLLMGKSSMHLLSRHLKRCRRMHACLMIAYSLPWQGFSWNLKLSWDGHSYTLRFYTRSHCNNCLKFIFRKIQLRVLYLTTTTKTSEKPSHYQKPFRERTFSMF